MILVDTSIWIDHLHVGEQHLVDLLSADLVLVHPHVVEELALGSMRDRDAVIEGLEALAAAPTVRHEEFLHLVDVERLQGRGLSAVDVHLLAAARLAGASLWTRDKRLRTAAEQLGIAHSAG